METTRRREKKRKTGDEVERQGSNERPSSFTLARCSGLDLIAKRSAGRWRRRQLYVVLDDWEKGYSIYRVPAEEFHSAPGVDAAPAESPLVRIEAEHPFSCSFVAHGTKIFAMQPPECCPGAPVFDTETLGMTVCPCLPTRGFMNISTRPLYASAGAGGSLLALVDTSLDVLSHDNKQWSWSRAEEEHAPPFSSRHVTCYALHPDGRTVFMSVWNPGDDHYERGKSTFALDTEALVWTYIGDWLLPFEGQAYYDRDLDALVGVLHPMHEKPGRLCCCDLPPRVARCDAMPAWKLGKDVLFQLGSNVHVSIALVYMGDSRFCLLERRASDFQRPRSLRVLEMTSFVLRYDKVGGLQTARHRSYASMSYQVAHHNEQYKPAAFWI